MRPWNLYKGPHKNKAIKQQNQRKHNEHLQQTRCYLVTSKKPKIQVAGGKPVLSVRLT